jgi:hypothetical protein
MPNPELSQYHDHDTNTVYDLKDATGRATLATVQADIRKSIISISTMANGQDADYTDWLFMSALNNGYFVGQDQAFVRIHFNSSLVSYSKPVRFIYYFDETHGQGVYICNVVTNYSTMENLGGHYKQGDVLDFIFFRHTNTFVLVGPSDSVDLSNYYTKTQTDTLLNAKVSDNPTFTEAATRQNIASGETFAVILGKIKKFFSDLKAVAFSGSYNDLTDTPTIPAAQVNSDWNANSGVSEILNKPTLATVATSGNYNDLDYKPTFSAGTGINIRGSGSSGYDWDYEIEFTGDADDVDFDNSVSGLSATNVEDAIDELAAEKADASSLAPVATSGQYSDLTGTPTIPAAQVQSDWTQADSTEVDYIKNKPTLAPVATSGAYGDLSGTPNLAAVATSGDYDDLINKRPSDYTGNTSASAVSVPNSTSYTELLTIALTPGTWMINWAASFPSAGSSNTGYRAAGLTTSATGDPYAYMMQQVPAVPNNTFTCLSSSCIFVASGSVTMRLKARQYQGTSGSALNVTPRLQAIRLL